MSTVVNFLRVSPNIIKPAYRTHRRAVEHLPKQTPKNGYTPLEEMSREEFVEHMKANPRSWGNQLPNHNAHPMSKGWVYVYDRSGGLSNSYYFPSQYQKKQKVSEAMRSIRNLPGCYVEVVYDV